MRGPVLAFVAGIMGTVAVGVLAYDVFIKQPTPTTAQPKPPSCTTFERYAGRCQLSDGAMPPVAPSPTRTHQWDVTCGEARHERTVYPGDVLINPGYCGYRNISISEEAIFTRISCRVHPSGPSIERTGCHSLDDRTKHTEDIRVLPGKEMATIVYGTVTHIRPLPNGKPVTVIVWGTFR